MSQVPVRPRVVLLHGFTQTGGVWAELARLLRGHLEAVTPDLPGHGQSPPEWDTDSLIEAGRRVAESSGPGGYVGYSLGGRIALHAALEADTNVERLVLVGVRAGLPPAEAAKRRDADMGLSKRLRSGSGNTMAEFVDDWLAQPFNARLPPVARHRDLRLTNRPEGLAASLLNCGVGTQQPLWNRLHELSMPIMLVVGQEDSDSFVTEAHQMARQIGPNADVVEVPSVGHAVPFEAPALFAELLREFFTAAA